MSCAHPKLGCLRCYARSYAIARIPLGRVPSLRACPVVHARPVLSIHHFWVATQHRKWAVAHPILSLHSSFLFLFVLPTVKPPEVSFITTKAPEPEKLAKMHILYKSEFNYNLSLITNYKIWVFFPEFTKHKNKAKSGLLFITRVLDVSPRPEYLWYLKCFPMTG